MIRQIIAAFLLLTGTAFFIAGTVGVLRFRDALSRLHAVAKADTVGLGFIVTGVAVLAPSAAVALKLVFIWIMAMVSSSLSAYLIAGAAHEEAPRR